MQLLAIIKKELRSYFNSPLAYIIIAVFLVVMNFLFFKSFFIAGQASMRAYFGLLPWLFLIIIPAITMRQWAEEKKLGTTELLYTWPIKEYQPVIGKFLASLAFVAIILLLTLSVPISIKLMGNLDLGVVAANYLASLLLAGAFLSIGLWISSLTDNQIIAFIVSIAASFAVFIIGETIITAFLPLWLAPFVNFLGLNSHFASITRGVIDSRDIIYYLSIIGFFLFLNARQLRKRG